MKRLSVAALFLVAPLTAWGQVSYSVGPPITGTLTAVNNGAGDQTEPHIDGNLCAYTDQQGGTASSIRYHDLSANTDNPVPSEAGSMDFLSDVRGNVLVFTRLNTQATIYSFDVTTAALTPIDPTPGSFRENAQIGAATIAWQDVNGATGASNIQAYDRASGTTVNVTHDSSQNQNPGISADGTVIAWEKCATFGAPCDIWSATGGSGAWTTHQLTNGSGAASHPDSNGSLVVYSANRSGDDDIYWQAATGGAEQHLALAGSQVNPSIAGSFIAFESEPVGGTTHNIFVFDISTSTLYQITNTTTDNTLNDMTVMSDGTVRVVWQVRESDWNVYAFSFKVSSCVDDGDDDHGRGDGDGMGHDHGHGDGDHLGRNHKHPECDGASADIGVASLHLSTTANQPSGVQSIQGTHASVTSSLPATVSLPQPDLKGAGCDSAPGSTVFAAVLAVLAWIGLSRRLSPSRAGRGRG